MSTQSEINIAVISNITLETYFRFDIENVFVENISKVNVSFIVYEESFSMELYRKIINADYIIVWLNIDCFYPNLINDLFINRVSNKTIMNDVKRKYQRLCTFLREKSQGKILWIGLEDYCYYKYIYVSGFLPANDGLIDRINLELNTILTKQDTYIDLKMIISKLGINRAYDDKSKYRWNTPYSRELFLEMSREIYKRCMIDHGISKKCIVLDCDNVLWGGVLSEDGIENIHLGSNGWGSSFQDFQRFVLNLYYHGVIIAICSKNECCDVLRMFREHDEMILKEEHIACFCVNWNNKSDNIKRISEILNIGLDSMVFVDDSDFEIQSIKMLLLEVTCIKYYRDSIYENLSCFNLNNNVNIEKIKQRNYTYQTNELRESLKSETNSFDEYIKALEMNVDIHEANLIELSRISELTQRTNKCTNGKRYTVEQLKQKLNNGYKLYSVSLSDRFSNLGLIGVIGIDNNALDLFSLSCRALGRNIEEIMIDFIYRQNISEQYFTLTPQNSELYVRLGKKLNTQISHI